MKSEVISRVMRQMGRRGGKIGGPKGGKARMAALTPEERRELARKAAAARWSKRDLKRSEPPSAALKNPVSDGVVTRTQSPLPEAPPTVAAVAAPEPVVAPSTPAAEMTITAALKILAGQGFQIGETAQFGGVTRVWVSDENGPVPVNLGSELRQLALGELTLDDVRARRRSASRF
jgi:hypothetical protein